MHKGFISHLISQNIDGLHLKSGIPYQNISELHGNVFIEYWIKCNTHYQRTYRTRISETNDHNTGRKWEENGWDGDLWDSLVLFGESIPKYKLEQAFIHASKSQLCIWIGSSLLVRPANLFPFNIKRIGGKVSIINLEPTPFDNVADIKFNENCDDVFKLLMKEMQIDVPDYIQNNEIKIIRDSEFIEILPYEINHSEIDKVEFLSMNDKIEITTESKPYKFSISPTTNHCQLRLHFLTPPKPPLEVSFSLPNLSSTSYLTAKFTPSKSIWSSITLSSTSN